MTLVEILTAISLFCPQDQWPNFAATGSVTNADYKYTMVNADCAKKVWKCIDGLRTPPEDPTKNKCMIFIPRHGDQEFDHWINIPHCALPNDPRAFEKCFR